MIHAYQEGHEMQLEQQASEILDIMYDSMTKQNFNSVSDDVDRVSDAVNR